MTQSGMSEEEDHVKDVKDQESGAEKSALNAADSCSSSLSGQMMSGNSDSDLGTDAAASHPE
jgi:hypothetical protein